MVRHEAAEALGAIGDFAALDVLREYKSNSCVEVAETCELALQRLECLQNQALDVASSSAYDSIGAYNHTSSIFKEICKLQIQRRPPKRRALQSLAPRSSTRRDRFGIDTRRCLRCATSTAPSRSRRSIKVRNVFSVLSLFSSLFRLVLRGQRAVSA